MLKICFKVTLPETDIEPENGWLEYDRFLLGPGLFSVLLLLVSGRVRFVVIFFVFILHQLYIFPKVLRKKFAKTLLHIIRCQGIGHLKAASMGSPA